jgi:hypothetical protein
MSQNLGRFPDPASHRLVERPATGTLACRGAAAMTEPSLPGEPIRALARKIASDAGRAASLDRACSADRALRAEVETLLRADARSGDLLDLPEEPAAGLERPGTDRAGAALGPYQLLRVIGEGGMGVVRGAEQTLATRSPAGSTLHMPDLDGPSFFSPPCSVRVSSATDTVTADRNGHSPAGHGFFPWLRVSGG